jgi:hypothetical protein
VIAGMYVSGDSPLGHDPSVHGRPGSALALTVPGLVGQPQARCGGGTPGPLARGACAVAPPGRRVACPGAGRNELSARLAVARPGAGIVGGEWASGADRHRHGGKVIAIAPVLRTVGVIDLALGQSCEDWSSLAPDGRRLDRRGAAVLHAILVAATIMPSADSLSPDHRCSGETIVTR